ncbi:MAG TPA: hypothetical protein VIL63_04420, partial [Terriglobales bacterium]
AYDEHKRAEVGQLELLDVKTAGDARATDRPAMDRSAMDRPPHSNLIHPAVRHAEPLSEIEE